VPASDPPARSLVRLGRLIPAQNRCVRRNRRRSAGVSSQALTDEEQRPRQGQTCVRSNGWGAGLVRAARRLSSGVSKGRMTRRYCYPWMGSAFPGLPARCRLPLPRGPARRSPVYAWARPLFVTLLLMAPLFLPAPAWARGNGGHSGRGHGSHHRAHHRGGSTWRGAPCVAGAAMPSRCGAPSAPGEPAAGTHADAPASTATAPAAPGSEGP